MTIARLASLALAFAAFLAISGCASTKSDMAGDAAATAPADEAAEPAATE